MNSISNSMMDGSGEGDPKTSSRFVAALDIGTTTIRCIIFDQTMQIRGLAHDQVGCKNYKGLF